MKSFWPVLLVLVLLSACESEPEKQEEAVPEQLVHDGTYVQDPHSLSNPHEAVTKHLDLELDIDFDKKVIHGIARYDIARSGDADQIIFDTDSLLIDKVTLNTSENSAIYSMGEGNEFGQKLSVSIHSNTRSVNIYYRTAPGSAAVQWLRPEQTMGKRHPFLFTQGQAILTRSWIPCQDSPGVRMTYNAKVNVPEGLMALMSAENPQEISESGVYEFKMEQAIPAYLIALAVGNLEYRAVSDNMGVYAEPQLVKAAAYEFEDMPKMMETAESLYGPYLWEQYDVIVLPPSFPFGGMENPRLTFATPTIIAGDRSLTSLVAHELAHSWSGNLVTNATWNDFWLNEGFTVYIEKRIMEALYGEGYTEMLNLLDYQDLMETIEKFGTENELTRLKLHLDDSNPDDGMTDIAYEKGYNFLRVLEQTVGRDRFDEFLKGYFNQFEFKSVTTEMFVDYLHDNLLQGDSGVIDVQEWVYGTGIPENRFVPQSDRFKNVERQMMAWFDGEIGLDQMDSDLWTTHEWLHFIRNLPQEITAERMAEIDSEMYLTQSKNAEIQAAWFEAAIDYNYPAVNDELEEFLRTVGRRKFLMPLYTALQKTPEGKEMAIQIYAQARPNYHSVSVRSIDALLDFDPEKYKGSISL